MTVNSDIRIDRDCCGAGVCKRGREGEGERGREEERGREREREREDRCQDEKRILIVSSVEQRGISAAQQYGYNIT